MQRVLSAIEAQSKDLHRLTELTDVLASTIKEEQKTKRELSRKLIEKHAEVQQLSQATALERQNTHDLSNAVEKLTHDLSVFRTSSLNERRALIDQVFDLRHALRVRALAQYRAIGLELGFDPDAEQIELDRKP